MRVHTFPHRGKHTQWTRPGVWTNTQIQMYKLRVPALFFLCPHPTHTTDTNTTNSTSHFSFCRTFTRTSIVRGCISGIDMLNLTCCDATCLCCVSVCARALACVRICVSLYNLTRDYMSSTELMSKSTGSAFGLTGGRTERHDEQEGGRGGETQ